MSRKKIRGVSSGREKSPLEQGVDLSKITAKQVLKNPDQFSVLKNATDVFFSIECDADFTQFLLEHGYSEEKIEKIRDLITNHLDPIKGFNCHGVKRVINHEFRQKEVRHFVQNYRKGIGRWLNGTIDCTSPPQLVVQKLPPLQEDTIIAYLDASEELHDKITNKMEEGGLDVDILFKGEVAVKKMKGMNKWQKTLSKDEKMQMYHTNLQTENINELIIKFIEQGEKQALAVFESILNRKSKYADIYKPVIETALSKLSANKHFLGSLFNFMCEDLFSEESQDIIDKQKWWEVINVLVKLGICKIRGRKWFKDVNKGKPRSYIDLPIQTVKSKQKTLRLPAEYLPIEWMDHRVLTQPFKNNDFSDFFMQLMKNGIKMDEYTKREIQKYRDALQNKGEEKRRYGLGFDRVLVKDIPGMEDKEVWFHFFKRDNDLPGEINIEIMINNVSVICKLDEKSEYLEPFFHGPIRMPKEIMKNFMSRTLYYYVLKYAYKLLVLPRTESPYESDDQSDKKPFQFSLEDEETEYEIPVQNGESSDKGQSTLVRRSAPSPHRRRLPAGHKASPEARQRAKEAMVELPDGYTFVVPRRRGRKIGVNVGLPKKFKLK